MTKNGFLTRRERLRKIRRQAIDLSNELRQVAQHPRTNPEWAEHHIEHVDDLADGLEDVEDPHDP